MPTIDFSKVEGIKPVPAGEYPATIVEAQDGMSQNNNPKIDLQWKLETGEKETDGHVVFEPLTFTKKTEWRVKRALRALGFEKDFAGEVTGEMLIGRSAIIVVEIEPSTQIDPETDEPYPPRNRVKSVKPLTKKAKAK